MTADRVPFVDLRGQAADLADEVADAWRACPERCDFILGEDVREFEAEFADFLGARHVIGVGSGLEALTLALDAAGVGRGDTVVVPANTYIATVLAALRLGARVAWCDVDADTRLATADTVAKAVDAAGEAAAVLPVHLTGRACDPGLFEFCAERGLAVIEDAAQSHGARFADGGVTGTRGLAGCFSFYPGKNLGAFGDGGAVCTDDDDMAERLRRLRNYGQRVKYEHVDRGVNSRLDTVQAAVLRIKLRRLADWNAARQAAAARYDALLADALPDLHRPPLGPEDGHVWHLYRVECDGPEQRAAVREHMDAAGVDTGIHYPVPCHRQECCAGDDFVAPDGGLPVSEAEAARTLSLPMFPEITAEQQERTVAALAAALSETATRT